MTTRRIGMLIVSMVAALLVSGSAAAEEADYVGFKKCRSCHKKEAIGNQSGWWEGSAHATAYETLATDKAKKWASEAGLGDPQAEEKCVKCHLTGHGVAEDRLRSTFDPMAGVQCEACHGAGSKYRKKKIMIDAKVAQEKGLVPQSAAVCTACHNDESPAWDPDRYALADGSKAGFDYDQAVKAIAHPVPEGYDPTAEGEAD